MVRAIIIDFDNTIGYFNQLVYLLNIIEKTHRRPTDKNDVSRLISLFPRILRPNIIDILKTIIDMKINNIVQFFILYTTNKNEKFVNSVIKVLEHRLEQSHPLFDYKIFSKDSNKSMDSLIGVSNMNTYPNPYIMCFIDNKTYDYFSDDIEVKKYYIKCDSYKYNYPIEYISKKMDYLIYNKMTRKLTSKYFIEIYKKKRKTNFDNLPDQIYELNSIYILNLLHDFCKMVLNEKIE